MSLTFLPGDLQADPKLANLRREELTSINATGVTDGDGAGEQPVEIWRSGEIIDERQAGAIQAGYASPPTFECKCCDDQFSLTSRTIFASHQIPQWKILPEIAFFATEAKCISAPQPSRDLDWHYESVCVLANKLYEAIAAYYKELVMERPIKVRSTHFRRLRDTGEKEGRQARLTGGAEPDGRPQHDSKCSWAKSVVPDPPGPRRG